MVLNYYSQVPFSTLHTSYTPMKIVQDPISATVKIFSKHLDREVTYRWAAPTDYQNTGISYPVLLMNDGQDFDKMRLKRTLATSFVSKRATPFIYIGITTNENRIHEYGLASSADFKGRGSRAKQYALFIIKELIPHLKQKFPISKKTADWVYCGMSLGGLSAFDIVYHHSHYFGRVGVFSGSFWWRNKAYIKNDMHDRSRMILDVVKNSQAPSHLKFWFQCGTEDEKADRNNNGIIDAIDDTQDLIMELRKKRYTYPGDITYVEVPGGKHDLPTWGKVFPEFIEWAFGSASEEKIQRILEDKDGVKARL